RIAATASLVCEQSSVTQTAEHEAMTNARCCLTIAREPRDGTDRPGDEQEAIGVPELVGARLQLPRKLHRYCDSRQVVIRKRRMAAVTGHEHFVVRRTVEHVLAVGEVSRRERRVDAHLVGIIRKRVEGPLRE